jgi:hypothetical protein
MKTSTIIGIILLVTLMQSATALNIDLNEEKTQQNVLGVYLEKDYYTVVLEDNKIVKIELNGEEKTDYEITTTKLKVIEFIQTYQEMSSIERIQYILTNFSLPLELMMDMAGEFIGN